jgi:hypothetical protein
MLSFSYDQQGSRSVLITSGSERNRVKQQSLSQRAICMDKAHTEQESSVWVGGLQQCEHRWLVVRLVCVCNITTGCMVTVLFSNGLSLQHSVLAANFPTQCPAELDQTTREHTHAVVFGTLDCQDF